MVRLLLRSDYLIDLGRRRNLPLRDLDTGYLLHSQLKELFHDLAPAPFSTSDISGPFTSVIAYSDVDSDTLHEHAKKYAEPSIFAGCDWDRIAHKEMPSCWHKEEILRFEVKVCPIVRIATDGSTYRKGAEVDAFLKACSDADDKSVEREQVYRDWFSKQISRKKPVELVEVALKGFRLGKYFRRQSKDRKGLIMWRPEAVMVGKIKVKDPACFNAVLRTGIGRHRAFGFGMLLLKPAG